MGAAARTHTTARLETATPLDRRASGTCSARAHRTRSRRAPDEPRPDTDPRVRRSAELLAALPRSIASRPPPLVRNEPLRQPREDDELPRPAKRHSPALSPPDPDRTLKGRGASPNLDRVSCKAPSSTPVTPAQPIPGRNAPRSPKVHRRNEPSPRWIATPSLQRRAQHSTRTWQDARIPLAIGDTRRRDGAFMEPSGRNRWQPVANGTPPKTAQTSRSATGGNPRQRFRSAW